jgi:HK97 family phage major capsid protein
VARNDRAYLEKHYGSKFNEWQQKAALGEASGVTGGYTVPPEFYQQLMTIMAEETFIRPNAFVVPMAGATPKVLKRIAASRLSAVRAGIGPAPVCIVGLVFLADPAGSSCPTTAQSCSQAGAGRR